MADHINGRAILQGVEATTALSFARRINTGPRAAISQKDFREPDRPRKIGNGRDKAVRAALETERFRARALPEAARARTQPSPRPASIKPSSIARLSALATALASNGSLRTSSAKPLGLGCNVPSDAE